jgi:hypothetical protein
MPLTDSRMSSHPSAGFAKTPRTPVGDAPVRPGAPTGGATLPELALLTVVVGVSAVSWSAIVLAELGLFTGPRLLGCAALVAGGVAVAARRDISSVVASRTTTSAWAWASLVLAIGLAASLYARPGECLLDGRDASVYVAIGRTIERTGGVVADDPLVAAVPPGLRDALLARDPILPDHLARFPGGILVSPGGTRLLPLFNHLLPAWFAALSALGVPGDGYAVNVVFGVLAVFAVWVVGRRAWSPAAGAVAALLLSVSYGQVVYSRLAFSEVLAQFLLIAGTGALLIARDTGSRLAGAAAGAAIGLTGFARLEGLVLIVPLALVFLAWSRPRFPLGAWRWLAGAVVVVGAHALAHALTISRLYTLRVATAAWHDLARAGSPLAHPPALVAAGALTIAVLAAMAWRRRVPHAARMGTTRAVVMLTAVACAGLAAPALVEAGRLISLPGLIAAVAGLAMATWRGDRQRLALVTVPFVVELIALGVWRESAALGSDFRRLVPVVLPVAVLGVGFLCAMVAARRRRVWQGVWLVPAGLAAFWTWQAWPLVEAPPMQGVNEQVAALARRLPPDSVVLSDRSASSHLALSLQSAFGVATLPLTERPSSAASVRAFAERVLAGGRPFFVLLGVYEGEIPRRLRRSDLAAFDVWPVGTARLEYTAAAPALNGFPRLLPKVSAQVSLYQVAPAGTREPTNLPLTVDIGRADFAFVSSGFYGPETLPGASARWTSGHAEVMLPRLAAGPLPISLVVRLAAYRPEGVARPTVRIGVDGHLVATLEGVPPAFETYRVQLPPSAVDSLRARAATLTIDAGTFVPRQGGLGSDPRVLGVAVDWFRFE